MPRGVFRNPRINPITGKQIRGFAGAYDTDRQREVASKGGKTAHERGHAHIFTADEAREAGRKGGLVTSADRDHMAEIGQLGGKANREREGN